VMIANRTRPPPSVRVFLISMRHEGVEVIAMKKHESTELARPPKGGGSWRPVV
jgi:hypothetical protein